jgi:hypothetical protein
MLRACLLKLRHLSHHHHLHPHNHLIGLTASYFTCHILLSPGYFVCKMRQYEVCACINTCNWKLDSRALQSNLHSERPVFDFRATGISSFISR